MGNASAHLPVHMQQEFAPPINYRRRIQARSTKLSLFFQNFMSHFMLELKANYTLEITNRFF